MARNPIPLPVPVPDPVEEDCPKCPPPGAPAWMATFADIATLLMAFFVLILSFAEFNQPKFKMVAGSLKESFGIQRRVPVIEQPKGTTILKLEFSPSPDPSVTKEMTQDTTHTEAPNLQRPETEQDGKGAPERPEETAAQKAAKELTEAIAEALSTGQIHAETRDGETIMTFDAPSASTLPAMLKDAAEALGEAKTATGQDTSGVMMQGLSDAMPQLADATEQQAAATQAAAAQGQAERKAGLAEGKLNVALRREIGEGLVTVEQREDRVFVTIGAGGAFPSGDAELTAEARDVMARLAFSAMDDASKITVTGHTDSVPLSASSPFRDNWGLAAARASSVVRELSGSSLIAPDRLTAISRGETMPVDDNATAEGRERNRRIEIEISY